jgi:DNA-binding IclR family transcriptional regulator
MGKTHEHHRTVDRVAELLEAAVAHPDGATLTQLARWVDAPVSSVQKLIDGLVAVGYLDEAGRRYRLGPAPSVLSIRAGRPAVSVRHGRLVELSDRLGLPVQLAVRVGEDAVWVDWAGADEAFDYALSSQVRRPLVDTAAGRVLFAHLPEAARRAVVARARPDDPAAAVALLETAERIRATGRETGRSGRLMPDAAAVAVPVREPGRDGPEVVAALSAVDRSGSLVGAAEETATVLHEAVGGLA